MYSVAVLLYLRKCVPCSFGLHEKDCQTGEFLHSFVRTGFSVLFTIYDRQDIFVEEEIFLHAPTIRALVALLTDARDYHFGDKRGIDLKFSISSGLYKYCYTARKRDNRWSMNGIYSRCSGVQTAPDT